MNHFVYASAWLTSIATLVISSSVAAADPNPAADKLVVDVVTLKSGQQYRGAAIGRESAGTSLLAVQREWLRRHHPKDFERLTADEISRARTVSQRLVDRIGEWLKEKPEPATLLAFLELDLEREEQLLRRLNGQGKPLELPQFVCVLIDEAKVRTAFVQPAESRKWAALAWQLKLDNVERRTRDELQRELAHHGVTENDSVNLWDRLPSLPQSDEEWAARRALVEFQLSKRLEFQGLGETLIRTGQNAAKIDLATLLPTLLQEQLQAQLGDLLGTGPGRGKSDVSVRLKKAIDLAESEKVRGFRMTELALDAHRRRVAVTTKFAVRLPSNRWETIWQYSTEEDGSKARPDAEQRIEGDPQVKDALGLLKGLDVGAADAVTGAVRVGAAVMTAQQRTDSEFHQFLGQYIRRLGGPPLRWSPSSVK